MNKDTKIRPFDCYVVYGWMTTELHLKGVELQVFAVIYHLTSAGSYDYVYEPRYLEQITGASRPTIIKVLKNLKALNILKEDVVVNHEKEGEVLKVFRLNASIFGDSETSLKIFKGLNFLIRNEERENKEERTKEENKEKEEKNSFKNNIDKAYMTVSNNNAYARVEETPKVELGEKSPNVLAVVREVIGYLNEKCGTSYRATSTAAKMHISARLAEGYTVEDFKKVIDKQHKKWAGTEFEMYLRPDTLFRPRKFDIYLNAPEPTGNAVGAMGIAYREGDGDLEGII